MFTNAPWLLLWPEWSQIKKQKEREGKKRKRRKRTTRRRRMKKKEKKKTLSLWCGKDEKTQVTFRKNKLHMLSTNTTDTSGLCRVLSFIVIDPSSSCLLIFRGQTRTQPAGGLHTWKETQEGTKHTEREAKSVSEHLNETPPAFTIQFIREYECNSSQGKTV